MPIGRWFVAVATALGVATLEAQGDLLAANSRLQVGVQARARGDLEGYFLNAAAAARLVPPHPIVLYHLARAAALTGRHDSALAVLANLAAVGSPRDPAADSGFISLWPRAEFKERAAALLKAAEPIVASDTAFVVSTPNLVVENIAFDSVTRRFYVGSMATRSILRADTIGRATTFVPASANVGQPLGMRVDHRRRVLWAAAIWPADSALGHPVQRSALLEVDLGSGEVRARYAPDDTSRPHLLNDIAIARTGDLYVTDSDARAIWRLPRGGRALEPWVRFDSTVLYPNGIALSPDHRLLFVAHQTGVLSIEIATRIVRPLEAPANASLMGFDGLYATPTGLAGIQNTMSVPQVIAIDLEYEAGRAPRVTCAVAIERRHPVYDMPTTGTVAGGRLLYVANSELRRLSPNGSLANPDSERRTVVLSLPLNGCGGRR